MAETGGGGLSQFPITGVEQILKRTIISSVAVGVVAGAAVVLAGAPLAAVGIAIGLGLALVNHRAFQSSAMRFTTPEGRVVRKPLAGSVAVRLGLCTAVAVGLLVAVRPMGWGTVGGLLIFQMVMLANGMVALLRYQREQLGGTGAGGA